MAEGHTLHQNQPEGGASALSDEQFRVLVDLLTPVHELAVAQLAMIAAQKPPEPELPAELPASTDD